MSVGSVTEQASGNSGTAAPVHESGTWRNSRLVARVDDRDKRCFRHSLRVSRTQNGDASEEAPPLCEVKCSGSRPLRRFSGLENPLVYPIHRELFARFMADRKSVV